LGIGHFKDWELGILKIGNWAF